MANLKGCFSHNSDHWSTPKPLYQYLMNKGYIDPCPLHSEEDNLNKIYNVGTKIFINPPYSEIDKWVSFIKNNRFTTRLLLIPARTDTVYFHELLKLSPVIYFIKGRLKFGESKESAPFPSLLLLFTIRPILFMTYYPNLFGCYNAVTIQDIITKELIQ